MKGQSMSLSVVGLIYSELIALALEPAGTSGGGEVGAGRGVAVRAREGAMSPLLLLLLSASLAAACDLRALDLSWPLAANETYTVNRFTPGTIDEGVAYGTNYTNNDFCSGEHTGTHLDAPFHFNTSGWTLEQIPLERLIANGVFLNVTDEVQGNVSFRLQPEHIDRWIEQNGEFPENALLLISYGWAQLHANATAVLGTDSTDILEYRYPGLSEATVDRLAQIDQLVGFGVDTISIDASDSGYAHSLLAGKNIYNLEQVNLDQPCLPARGFKVVVMPVKIGGGTGAPARVVALPPCRPAPPRPRPPQLSHRAS